MSIVSEAIKMYLEGKETSTKTVKDKNGKPILKIHQIKK